MTTNKPEVVAYRYTASRSFGKRNPKWHYQESFPHAENRKVEEIGRLEKLIRLSDHEALQAECEKLVSALRRISFRASMHECRQTPTSDLQRAFADLMQQADDALYDFYNESMPGQRRCEYAGCCEPAVEEALCHAHLEDWREQQTIDEAMQEGRKP